MKRFDDEDPQPNDSRNELLAIGAIIALVILAVIVTGEVFR